MQSIDNCSRLTAVSLVGADDNTDLTDLEDISRLYPPTFIKWGILYAPGKEDQPRNPSRQWREALAAHEELRQQVCVHLCYKRAFEELLKSQLPQDLRYFNSWQLNINARGEDFTKEETKRIYREALKEVKNLVLQCHDGTRQAILEFLSSVSVDHSRIAVLIDDSKGKGIGKDDRQWIETAEKAKELFPRTTRIFAGGINHQNVESVLKALHSVPQAHFCIDMESGLRSIDDNGLDAFDVVKCIRVLRSASKFRALIE